MFTDNDAERYKACRIWLQRRLGTPEQLARYAAFVSGYEASRASAIVTSPPQTNLFNVTPEPPAELPAEEFSVPTPPAVQLVCDQPSFPQDVKVWPLIGLASIHGKHGGAWRLWVLARALDVYGSGWVFRSVLWSWLSVLGVIERDRYRWLRDALTLGLIGKGEGGRYTLASLAKAAVLLGSDIGAPVIVSPAALFRSGWRSVIWSGYLATLHGRPVSQATKEQITGVDPRTQRNYQATAPGGRRRNYARTNLPGDHATGLRDNGRPGAFVGRDGRMVYRLPDIRTVPSGVARLTSKGRSRKAQKQVNHLSSEGQVKGMVLKLFHETTQGVKAALRKVSRSDLPPWEMPNEVFELFHAGRSVNLWMPIAVGAIQP